MRRISRLFLFLKSAKRHRVRPLNRVIRIAECCQKTSARMPKRSFLDRILTANLLFVQDRLNNYLRDPATFAEHTGDFQYRPQSKRLPAIFSKRRSYGPTASR